MKYKKVFKERVIFSDNMYKKRGMLAINLLSIFNTI